TLPPNCRQHTVSVRVQQHTVSVRVQQHTVSVRVQQHTVSVRVQFRVLGGYEPGTRRLPRGRPGLCGARACRPIHAVAGWLRPCRNVNWRSMPRTFGHIPGYPVGSEFADRRAASAAGVHGANVAGIWGTESEGAESNTPG